MKQLDNKEFRDFLEGGIVEPFCGNEYTFTNYYDDNGAGIYYDLATNEFTEIINIKLTPEQLNQIEDLIIDFCNNEMIVDEPDDQDPYPSDWELWKKFY